MILSFESFVASHRGAFATNCKCYKRPLWVSSAWRMGNHDTRLRSSLLVSWQFHDFWLWDDWRFLLKDLVLLLQLNLGLFNTIVGQRDAFQLWLDYFAALLWRVWLVSAVTASRFFNGSVAIDLIYYFSASRCLLLEKIDNERSISRKGCVTF